MAGGPGRQRAVVFSSRAPPQDPEELWVGNAVCLAAGLTCSITYLIKLV